MKQMIAMATLFAMLGFPGIGLACEAGEACSVQEGEYFYKLPESYSPSNPSPALVFIHGYGSSAQSALNNKAMEALINREGLILLSLQGLESLRTGKRTWSYPGSPAQQRDEFAYVKSVLEDARSRLAIDPQKIMVGGFSIGGSMTWYLACEMGERFAGFAPIAGAFWEPLPSHCKGPAPHLFHVHGTSDRVVPIEGRPIMDRFHQGHLYESLEILKEGGRWSLAEKSIEALPELDCQAWDRDSGEKGHIQLCLHDGGHSFKVAYLEMAWKGLSKQRGWSR